MDILNNKKPSGSENLIQKKKVLSLGMTIFILFNFLVIVGFCKFSFFILKNHRSAVSRDVFVKTYAEAKPFAEQSTNKKSYLVLKNQNKAIPAPFFNNQAVENQKKKSPKPTNINIATKAPDLIFDTKVTEKVTQKATEKQVIASVKPIKRPPVLLKKAPVDKSVDLDKNVSLDDLMVSGLNLINESEKIVAHSDMLLNDTTQAEENEIIVASSLIKNAQNETLLSKPVINENIAKKSDSLLLKKHKTNQKETQWIDVAQLRQQILQDNKINEQNKAMLEMNESKQTAMLNSTSSNDSLINEQEATKTAVVQDIPFVGTQQKTTQTAVVQDIPFVGTQQKTTQTADNKDLSIKANSSKKENLSVLAGNTASLWKIAEVNTKAGQKKNNFKNDKPKAIEQPKEDIIPEIETAENKPTVIYRKGKVVATKQNTPTEDKSLNWFDKQEAAVWTNMSQSDTPSVWTTADNADLPSDTAKAFRIANEMPKAKTTKTSPLKKLENFKKAPDSALNKNQKAETPKTIKFPEKGAAPVDDKGIMNKLFSFFDAPTGENAVEIEKNLGKAPNVFSANKNNNNPQQTTKKSTLKEIAPSKEDDLPQIVPTELRLTFKPKSTEISAQSVKWIKAFGQKAKKDIQRAVEVRMSNIDIPIQEKRFALIRSTLVGVGMENVQVLPIITQRTPHTIVLRMVTLPEEGYTEYTSEVYGVKRRRFYQQW